MQHVAERVKLKADIYDVMQTKRLKKKFEDVVMFEGELSTKMHLRVDRNNNNSNNN